MASTRLAAPRAAPAHLAAVPRRRLHVVVAQSLAGLALLGAAAVAGFAFVHRPWENRLDVWGFAALPAAPSSRRWHLVADAGSLPVLALGVCLAAALSLWRDRLRAVACLLGPLAAVVVTERIAKPLVGRQVTPFGGYSYPSGTVTAVTALAVVAVLCLPRLLRPLAAVLGAVAVAAVCCAVVALRWHFPTDAAGGALVGGGAVLLVDGALHLPGAVSGRRRRATGPPAAQLAGPPSVPGAPSRGPYSASY